MLIAQTGSGNTYIHTTVRTRLKSLTTDNPCITCMGTRHHLDTHMGSRRTQVLNRPFFLHEGNLHTDTESNQLSHETPNDRTAAFTLNDISLNTLHHQQKSPPVLRYGSNKDGNEAKPKRVPILRPLQQAIVVLTRILDSLASASLAILFD